MSSLWIWYKTCSARGESAGSTTLYKTTETSPNSRFGPRLQDLSALNLTVFYVNDWWPSALRLGLFVCELLPGRCDSLALCVVVFMVIINSFYYHLIKKPKSMLVFDVGFLWHTFRFMSSFSHVNLFIRPTYLQCYLRAMCFQFTSCWVFVTNAFLWASDLVIHFCTMDLQREKNSLPTTLWKNFFKRKYMAYNNQIQSKRAFR